MQDLWNNQLLGCADEGTWVGTALTTCAENDGTLWQAIRVRVGAVSMHGGMIPSDCWNQGSVLAYKNEME